MSADTHSIYSTGYYEVHPLHDFAKVRLGWTPPPASIIERAAIGHTAGGTTRTPKDLRPRFVQVVRATDVDARGYVDCTQAPLAQLPENPAASEAIVTEHSLTPNSVLLCLRGVYRVGLLNEHSLGSHTPHAFRIPLVATSTWAVITPDPQVMSVQYLAWDLMRKHTRLRIEHMRTGTSVSFIPVLDLKRLTLVIPHRTLQDAITNASRLVDEVESLERHRIETLRSSLAALIPSPCRNRSQHSPKNNEHLR